MVHPGMLAGGSKLPEEPQITGLRTWKAGKHHSLQPEHLPELITQLGQESRRERRADG